MTPAVAYKVLTDAEMKTLERGVFVGASIDLADGYIHLSAADQLTETVERHFAGQTDLWVAAIDLSAHGDAVKWEESRGGALFPHLYGPLLLETVIAYEPLTRGADGTVRLPVAG
jgi:uncharacterized protein (DUF952 family)